MGEAKHRKANAAVRRNVDPNAMQIAHRIVLLIGKQGKVSLPAAVDAVLMVLTALVTSAPDVDHRREVCRNIRDEIPSIVKEADKLRTRLIGTGERSGECSLCESGFTKKEAFPEGWEGLADKIGAEFVNVRFSDAISSLRLVLAFLLSQACANCRKLTVEVIKGRLTQIPSVEEPYFKLHHVQ